MKKIRSQLCIPRSSELHKPLPDEKQDLTIKISHLTVKTTAPGEWWVLAWLILQLGAVAKTMDFNL